MNPWYFLFALVTSALAFGVAWIAGINFGRNLGTAAVTLLSLYFIHCAIRLSFKDQEEEE